MSTAVTVLLLSLAIGVVAGLRALTAPAAVSWAPRSAGSSWPTPGSPSSATPSRPGSSRCSPSSSWSPISSRPRPAARCRCSSARASSAARSAARPSAPPGGDAGRRARRRRRRGGDRHARRDARSARGSRGGLRPAIVRPRFIEDAVAHRRRPADRGVARDDSASTPSSSAPARPARRWPAG